MHELSIASSIVATVSEYAGHPGVGKIVEVRIRVGALAGVSKDSLLFCYDIASKDTVLEGSALVVQELPVVIFCVPCTVERVLPSVQLFRCPVCNTPSGDIRQGRELEIESTVVDEYAST